MDPLGWDMTLFVTFDTKSSVVNKGLSDSNNSFVMCNIYGTMYIRDAPANGLVMLYLTFSDFEFLDRVEASFDEGGALAEAISSGKASTCLFSVNFLSI